jgi:hypothetical protein
MKQKDVEFVTVEVCRNHFTLRLVFSWPNDMDTEQALLYSIQKWETIEKEHLEKGIDFPVGGQSETCALCYLYDDQRSSVGLRNCEGCPVVDDDPDRRACRKTPFGSYICAKDRRELAQCAHDEAEFLRSLLDRMRSKDEESE